jgi:toxin YoeB
MKPLKHGWSGWWSREVNEKDRLVYRVTGETIELGKVGGHYDD